MTARYRAQREVKRSKPTCARCSIALSATDVADGVFVDLEIALVSVLSGTVCAACADALRAVAYVEREARARAEE